MNDTTAARTGRNNFAMLTALWVACEAFMGGIIHGLKLPVSGLLVGSSAVICIGLIAHYHPTRSAVLKATLLVCIFKMMLSPQSPPMAYVAVAFQGITGALLLPGKKHFAIRHTLFCLLALVESALQRIIILSFIYGKNLWKVADETVSKLFGLKQNAPVSLGLALVYLGIHLAAGLLAARFTLMAIRKGGVWRKQYAGWNKASEQSGNPGPVQQDKTGSHKRKINRGAMVLFALLAILYVLAMKTDNRQAGLISGILFRSAVLLALWYFILGPLLTLLITRWLRKKSAAYAHEIESINQALPGMTRMLRDCWILSARQKGPGRMALFGKLVITQTLHSTDEP